MPAKNLDRIDTENLFLHIYNKGLDKRVIFNDDEDYKVFINYLQEYLSAPKDPESTKQSFEVNGRTFRGTPHLPKNYFQTVELISYSLMPDHFHLLLHQVSKGSVENFLRSLCTRYSMYFNKKYARSGSLFAGPYKSISVETGNLAKLTRFLHQAQYSSYPEYLGKRSSSWVNKEIVLSSFGKDYQGFVDQYQSDKTLERILLEDEVEHLTRRNPTSTQAHVSTVSEALEMRNPASNEAEPEIPNINLKARPKKRTNEFITASFVVFALLFTNGIRNIWINEYKSVKPLSSNTPQVLSVAKEVNTAPADAVKTQISEATSEAKLKVTAIVKLEDGSSYVNIRQKSAASSKKISEAKDGEAFELISRNKDWFEVKIASGSGFISARYMEENK